MLTAARGSLINAYIYAGRGQRVNSNLLRILRGGFVRCCIIRLLLRHPRLRRVCVKAR